MVDDRGIPRDEGIRFEKDCRPQMVSCPICKSRRLHYAFSMGNYRVVRCGDCRLLMLNPQPSTADLERLYSGDYYLGRDSGVKNERVQEMKKTTARLYLTEIFKYRGFHGGRLLEVGCGHGEFLQEAQAVGYDVTGVEIIESAADHARESLGGRGRLIHGEIGALVGEEQIYDVCVACDVIEHCRDPIGVLRTIRRLLKPDGILFLATPSLDSWSARLLRQAWMEFKVDHLFYFDTQTIQNALFVADYRNIIIQPGWKFLSLEYAADHFSRFNVPYISHVVSALTRFLPQTWREKNVRVVASGMMAFARPGTVRERKKLSVIVPLYNEANTFNPLMQALLAKDIAGLESEVIVVESNSTDGSREMALSYKKDSRVQVILEEKPKGKGHAVRRGLENATGDFVIIQDADLEYDLEDYESLLDPLIQGREAFILGARHGGKQWWKLRKFSRQGIFTFQQILALAVNCAHWFFTTFINILYGLDLRDPQTMFKVFRRDCLFGLSFECNRFNYDYELLVKLVRKGYNPIEIPVNYRSRSFQEGKKINIFIDPIYGLATLIWLRFKSVNPMEGARQWAQRRNEAGNMDIEGR